MSGDEESGTPLASVLGARKVLTNPTLPDASLDSAIRGAFTRGDPALLEIAIASREVEGIQGREILIRYPMVPLVPGFTPSAISLYLARRIPRA